MLRHITRLIAGMLAAGLLLALAPSASATTSYDITQVGDASWVSVTSNGRELSGQTTASNGLQVTATVRLRIDDIGALREGDTVLVKATAASGSHFGPNLFSRTTLPPSLLDRQGNAMFTVSNADGDNRVLKLTRTGTTALGSYSCDLTATNKLWRWTPESKTSTWRIGKSSTYTFASRPQVNTPCASNNNGEWVPQVQGNSIEVNQWFLNCGTMRSIMDGPDTSGIRTESQVGWARIIPESGRITSLDVSNNSNNGAFVLEAVDGRTPGYRDGRTGVFRLSWKSDVDISTYDKAVANLPVGSVAVMERGDGSWDIAYNIGSRLPGLANSLKMPDSSDPATLELQRNTGNIWQAAQTTFYVRFQDESVPNRVSVETRGTEYALRSQTLTTKTVDPAVGQGQSAIRYDPNGGDGDAFMKVGDSGTTATAAEAGVFLRKGHTFAGWNTKADGTGTAYKAGAGIAYPAEGQTLTLYAQWKANTYKTEFRDWQGRTITSGTAKYGTTPTVPALSDTTWLADPDMNFDNVDGWRDDWWHGSPTFTKDGLTVNSRDTRANGKTVGANAAIHVEADADYSKANATKSSGIGFNINNGSTSYQGWDTCPNGRQCEVDTVLMAGLASSQTIEPWVQIANDQFNDYGTATVHRMQLTQVDPTTHNGIARDGYVFTGWDKDPSKPVEGDTVYTAQYRPAVYKVRFDANGGTGTMAEQSHTYDQRQALTASAFTREGYRFTGWNTRRDGKGKAFTDKQTVTNLLAHDGAVGVLYAQWERIPETALPRSGGTMTHNLTTILGGLLILALPFVLMRRRRLG
ncbi:MAG: InlB B-repeat-containing protein [Bifidobacterium sp.]|uniref:InlB B-repeat-containing protein n=1 Tax=Bifidobacterium sp. TaxID=41200 RepID=UPI00283AFACA|nr:InlB B-repeat-containing protein [Bifidobacterium sp.]MDR3912124.1 InlB B-repeat-containing protein [Bifidobacterium sp.]